MEAIVAGAADGGAAAVDMHAYPTSSYCILFRSNLICLYLHVCQHVVKLIPVFTTPSPYSGPSRTSKRSDSLCLKRHYPFLPKHSCPPSHQHISPSHTHNCLQQLLPNHTPTIIHHRSIAQDPDQCRQAIKFRPYRTLQLDSAFKYLSVHNKIIINVMCP